MHARAGAEATYGVGGVHHERLSVLVDEIVLAVRVVDLVGVLRIDVPLGGGVVQSNGVCAHVLRKFQKRVAILLVLAYEAAADHQVTGACPSAVQKFGQVQFGIQTAHDTGSLDRTTIETEALGADDALEVNAGARSVLHAEAVHGIVHAQVALFVTAEDEALAELLEVVAHGHFQIGHTVLRVAVSDAGTQVGLACGISCQMGFVALETSACLEVVVRIDQVHPCVGREALRRYHGTDVFIFVVVLCIGAEIAMQLASFLREQSGGHGQQGEEREPS